MKKLFLIMLSMLCATCGIVVAHDYVPGAPQQYPVLLRGGDLYTVANGVMPATDLLFENGKITAIGKNLPLPAGVDSVVVIDVSGKRVYPGLIDPVSTLGLIEIGAVRATRDNAEVGALTPEVQTHIAYNPDSEIIPTIRSNGIVASLIAPQGGTISGRSSLLYLDGWTKEDAMISENLGLHINWPRAGIQTGWRARSTPEEQRKQNAENRRKLEDAFKTARSYWQARNNGTQQEIDLRWEAMMPLFDKEMTLFINADDLRQIREAISFVVENDLRAVIVGAREAWRVADLLARHHIPVILSRVQERPYRADDDTDINFKQPKLLQDAGVKFAIGYGQGNWQNRSLPFQGAQAVAFGLDRADALRALTLSTAEIMGVDDRLGSLEVGKEATIVVSDGDIMDPITQQVTRMWIRGRDVDLDNKQKELYRKYRAKEFPIE